jgi:hypothetical protein
MWSNKKQVRRNKMNQIIAVDVNGKFFIEYFTKSIMSDIINNKNIIINKIKIKIILLFVL